MTARSSLILASLVAGWLIVTVVGGLLAAAWW